MINFIISPIFTVGMAEEVNTPNYVSQPKEMMIHESGFAIVKDIAKIDAQDTVQVELPKETILRTLIILDGGKRVKSFNSSNIENFPPPTIMYGRAPESSVRSDLSPQKTPTTPSPQPSQENIISWKTDIKGQREVTLEYSVSGISWSPIYDLNLSNKENSMLVYSALITNTVMPFKEVKIGLTAGDSKQWQDNPYYDRRLPAEVAIIYDITLDTPIRQAPSPRINVGCKYEVGKRNLDIGTTSIEILSADLKYRKEFVWVTLFGQRVDIHYEIKNTTAQTLAKGGVDVYQNGTYLGKDNILLTSPGELAHITFSGADAIKVSKDINLTTVEDRSQNKNRHEVSLNIGNISKEDVAVKIFDMKYPYTSDIEYSVKPIKESGNTVIWEIALPPAGKKSILYDFYSDGRYTNPYDASY
ncbi:MAG: DUF4139 domain-containing protein [Candidatus Omnitrophica bacterium]|nr:DUF4139 domain-containing protein [Candidatus Omnitrophota bacterium]